MMIRSLPRLAALLLLLLSVSAQAEKLNTSLFSHQAAKGYDVVAYQSEQRAVKGSSQYRYIWQGASWLFASEAHLKAFMAEPQRYAPQFGGYCAYAVGAKNDLVDIDPEAFTVVAGKLYLNYSPEVQKLWLAHRDAYIQQGERNWPALSR